LGELTTLLQFLQIENLRYFFSYWNRLPEKLFEKKCTVVFAASNAGFSLVSGRQALHGFLQNDLIKTLRP
jgi:hypothetical protein